MAYDYRNELKKVKEHYENDPLQRRLSVLLTGETNAGKTYLLRTARRPIHVDSFDPGGTKCLRDLIRSGDVVADTRWEDEDPFSPKAFAGWMRSVDLRLQIGYFEKFGTYCLDSATTWGEAVMNYQLSGRNASGEAPQHRKDYNPQKIFMQNYIRKLMNIPCDFIMTAHLKENVKLLRVDSSTGVRTEETKYRFYTTGQAVITVPLLFDEIWVLRGRGSPPKREVITDALGEFNARSRLKMNGLLDASEAPDFRAILKKAGFSSEDKPKLDFGGEDGDN